MAAGPEAMGGHALTRTRPCPEDPVRSSLPRGSGGGLAVRMPRPRAEAMGSLRVMAGVPHHALVIPARVSAHWLLLPPVLRALEQALPVLTPGPRTLRGGHCGPAGTRWPFGWNLGPEADLRPPLREPRTQVGSLGVLLGAGLGERGPRRPSQQADPPGPPRSSLGRGATGFLPGSQSHIL